MVFCLAVVFVRVSGIVMWWNRRPASPTLRKTGAVVMLVVALAFPLSGAVLLLDALLLSRLPALKHRLS